MDYVSNTNMARFYRSGFISNRIVECKIRKCLNGAQLKNHSYFIIIIINSSLELKNSFVSALLARATL